MEFDAEAEQGSKSFASILTLPTSSEPATLLNNVLDLIKDFSTRIADLIGQRVTFEGFCDLVLQERYASPQALDRS